MSSRFIRRDVLSGRYMALSPGSGASVVAANGQLTFQAWDLAAPVDLSETAVEAISAGSVGSVVRIGWWRDDGTFDKPGALISDLDTVDTTSTGIKIVTHAPSLELPSGRVWVGAVAQGAPATNPTMRHATVGIAPHSVKVGTAAVFWAHLQSGVTGALPDPPVINSTTSAPMAVRVRFA